MPRASALGRGLGALLAEIEAAYDLNSDDEQSKEFVEKEIHRFSKKDIKFIDTFSTFIQKEAAIKTLQYIYRQPEKRKTHKRSEVKIVIQEIHEKFPNLKVVELLKRAAEQLGMDYLAVRKHYYNL